MNNLRVNESSSSVHVVHSNVEIVGGRQPKKVRSCPECQAVVPHDVGLVLLLAQVVEHWGILEVAEVDVEEALVAAVVAAQLGTLLQESTVDLNCLFLIVLLNQ